MDPKTKIETRLVCSLPSHRHSYTVEVFFYAVPVIPSQMKVTHQILSHWEPFRDPKARFAGSRRDEQLSLRTRQDIVATVEDSVLRTEMTGLESLEEDTPTRILFYTPMGWLGQIRSHRRDESWSASI